MSRYSHDIIDGYNGIMALDVRDIPREHRKQAIDQHINDIKEYKLDQASRPARLRYENTVLHAEHIHKLDTDATNKRNMDAFAAQALKDKMDNETRCRNKERARLLARNTQNLWY